MYLQDGIRQGVGRRRKWWLDGAALDLDFVGAHQRHERRGYMLGQKNDGSAFKKLLTTTRSSTGMADTTWGEWRLFQANTPRITDKGLLIEGSRTNVVLWNRDLTNAAWTPSNITAAKDQQGVDGAANSASSITATAGNGTILQAITLASSNRWHTAFVKRLVGSGVVEMTMDNGATWTGVTVTAAWTRVSIPTQSLTNPTVGFRIVTNSDAIAVDFVQNEQNNVYGTSPIEVTTVAVARTSDTVTVNNFADWYNVTNSSFYAEASMLANLTTSQYIAAISDGTAGAEELGIYVDASEVPTLAHFDGSTGSPVTTAVTSVPGTAFKMAGRFVLNDLNLAVNGTIGTADNTATMPTVNQCHLGTSGAATLRMVGYIRRFAYFPSALSDAQLQALTA